MTSISNKRILVTGAGGLIGSYAANLLHRLLIDVVGLDYNSSVVEYAWPMVKMDLLKDDVAEVVKDHSIDTIVHCAAVIPRSFSETDAIYTTNKQIDTNILKSAAATDARIIYTSSTSVYERSSFIIKETDKINISNLYSKGKYETEQAIRNLSERNIILRINAPYAREQRMNTVLKIFIEKALLNLPLSYHGTGQREQDFTAAEDIASAVVKCIENDRVGGIFNISGGSPVTMRDLASKIVGLVPGCRSPIVASGIVDEQESYKAAFSIEKANLFLDWKPKVTLEEGIKKWVNHLLNENRNTI